MNEERKKFPVGTALRHAETLKAILNDTCTHIEIVGSVRRRKPEVKDLEILCVSKTIQRIPDGGMFEESVEALDQRLQKMMKEGILRLRPNKIGAVTYGPSNKFFLYRTEDEEIPVDIFQTYEKAWWNVLVCRTGGAESNTQIATNAIRNGLSWHNCAHGFSPHGTGVDKIHLIPKNEEDVFFFSKLNYRLPIDRK